MQLLAAACIHALQTLFGRRVIRFKHFSETFKSRLYLMHHHFFTSERRGTQLLTAMSEMSASIPDAFYF